MIGIRKAETLPNNITDDKIHESSLPLVLAIYIL